MEFSEIEKSVLRDLNPPKEMEPQDKNCWYALRGLYQVYHAQSISRDQAKKAKLDSGVYTESFQVQVRYHSS